MAYNLAVTLPSIYASFTPSYPPDSHLFLIVLAERVVGERAREGGWIRTETRKRENSEVSLNLLLCVYVFGNCSLTVPAVAVVAVDTSISIHI